MLLEEFLATYLRISDDDEDMDEVKKESSSISNQRKVLKDFISNNAELATYPIKEFLDDGFSGVNFNRPGVQKLLKEVRKNKVKCIIVKDLSRFGRNYIEMGDYIEQIFPFLGVRFIAVSDHYDSFRNSGGIEIGFKNLIHDLYSRDLSKKIKSVKYLQQKKGVYYGGDVPYGYTYNKENTAEAPKGMYCQEPYAAQIVKKIFVLAVKGSTPSEIALYLNNERIATPGLYKNKTTGQNYKLKNGKTNLWTSAHVRAIIQNEVYIGTYVCHKSTTIRPRETVKNTECDYLRFENSHIALVSKEMYDAAQKVVQVRGKRGHYKKDEDMHVLKGKVKCGCCGYSMNFNGRTSNLYYSCRMGNNCGSHLRIGAESLEQVVSELIQQMISVYLEFDEEQKTEKSRRFSELGKLREEQRILEMKTEHYKSSRLILYRQWKEGMVTKGGYIDKRDEYIKQESDCQKELKILKQKLELLSAQQPEEISLDCLQTYSSARTITKELVDDLIMRIDVYESDRIEITWNDGYSEIVQNAKNG